MKKYKYIIVGGGISGVKAATYLRQVDPSAEIALFSGESIPPYDRPPLSKELLKGEKNLNEITLLSKDESLQKKIDLYLDSPIKKIIPDTRKILSFDDKEYGYEKLFLATGGSPRKLTLPGSSHEKICYLRTYEDAVKIKTLAQQSSSVAVLGGGYIGMELASFFTSMGLEVHVIDHNKLLWNHFLNENYSKFLTSRAEKMGIHFHFGTTIQEFHSSDSNIRFILTDQTKLKVDFIGIGIGIELNTLLPRECGLRIEKGIVVNSQMQTNIPDIFAGGDVAQFPDPYFGISRVVEHWGHAEYSGLVAAANMSGQTYHYDLLNYAWTDVLGYHIEFAGLTTNKHQIEIRGDLNDHQFTLLYFNGEYLEGFMAFNPDLKELPILQKWIKKRGSLKKVRDQIVQKNISLKTITI